MYRAYSVITEKTMETDAEGSTVIRGIASTPTPDRMRDIIDPMGAKFKIPMPLLWQHQHAAPVGHVVFAQPKRTGIPFEAMLPNVKEAGRLKDRVDEARQSLKYGLVAAVSIGFSAERENIEVMEDGGYRFKEWEWLELSLVTIPANAEAIIETVKAFDGRNLDLAASGNRIVTASPKQLPGAAGQHREKHRGFFYLDPRKRK